MDMDTGEMPGILKEGKRGSYGDLKDGSAALWAATGMCLMGFIDNFVKGVAQAVGLWRFHPVRSAMVLAVLGPLALVAGW